MQLESVLSRGYDGVAVDLCARAAAQPPRAAAADAADARWADPQVIGRLDALRMLLRRADGCDGRLHPQPTTPSMSIQRSTIDQISRCTLPSAEGGSVVSSAKGCRCQSVFISILVSAVHYLRCAVPYHMCRRNSALYRSLVLRCKWK